MVLLVNLTKVSKLIDSDMHKWIDMKWKTMLRYLPMIVRLLKGWYNFHFVSEEDLDKIKSIQ